MTACHAVSAWATTGQPRCRYGLVSFSSSVDACYDGGNGRKCCSYYAAPWFCYYRGGHRCHRESDAGAMSAPCGVNRRTSYENLIRNAAKLSDRQRTWVKMFSIVRGNKRGTTKYSLYYIYSSLELWVCFRMFPSFLPGIIKQLILC